MPPIEGSFTKAQIRQAIIMALINRDDYLIETPTSIASATSQTFGQIAGLYPDSHWLGAEARATVSGAKETRRISASTGSSGVITIVSPGFSATPTVATIEILRSGMSFAQFDNAIEEAMHWLVRRMPVDATDETLMTEPGRDEFPTPSSWIILYGAEIDWSAIGGDRHIANLTTISTSEKTFAATTTRYSQGFFVDQEMQLSEIWLYLRKVEATAGNLAGTFVVDVRSNASGVPTGGAGGILKTSGTVAVSSLVNARYGWVKVALSTPIILTSQTVYHLSFNPAAVTGLDASNYLAWKTDTSAGYGNGAPALSSNGGTTFAAETGYDFIFRLFDQSRRDWKDVNDRWIDVPNASSRTVLFRPDTRWPTGMPIRLLGGIKATSLDGIANDAVVCDIDPQIVIDLAKRYWVEMREMTVGGQALAIARDSRIFTQRDIANARPLRPGHVLERQ